MPNILDIFSDDAFSELAMTEAISNVDHVPGAAGEFFVGQGRGIPTTHVAVEMRNTELSLIPTSPRGAPSPQEVRDKATLRKLPTTHIQLESTILPDSIQDARGFGTDQLASAQAVMNDLLFKINSRLDLTFESLRLGALKGEIVDADGTVILNLFDVFDVSEPSSIEFSSSAGTLREKCMAVKRYIEKAAKTTLPNSAQVVALCSDAFFDVFTSHADVAQAFGNYEAASVALAADVRPGFQFGGIVWKNYRGSDDVTGEESSDGQLVGKVGIASGDCRFALAGVPALYDEVFSPASSFSEVNTAGLPRYAKVAVDPLFGAWARIHVESNPLPIVRKPLTLVRGTFA